MRRFVEIPIFWILCLYSLEARAAEKLQIHVGESTSVTSHGEEDLHVTRKGVVSLTFMESGRWQLTGLKKGFVVVSGTNTTKTGSPITIYHVSVAKTQILPPTHKQNIGNKFPSWVCNETEISCEKNLIDGTIYNYAKFLAAKSECAATPDCRFFGQLGGMRTIAANIVMYSKSEADSVGFTPQDLIVEKNQLKAPQISDTFRNRSKKNKISVIGDPIVRVIPNTESEIRTGGEFSYVSSTRRGESTAWKSYGLNLKITYIPNSKTLGNLKYTVELSNRQSKRSIGSNIMRGQLTLVQGEPQIAGQMNVKQADETKQFSPFWNRIPIISPFFRSNDHGTSINKIVVIFTLLANEEFTRDHHPVLRLDQGE